MIRECRAVNRDLDLLSNLRKLSKYLLRKLAATTAVFLLIDRFAQIQEAQQAIIYFNYILYCHLKIKALKL